MKINMENSIVRFLVDGADLNNGCSVIRRVLFSIMMSVVLGCIAVAVAVAVVFTIAGTVLYLFSPWFGQLDIGLSMSWLGPEWWARSLRTGAAIGLILTTIATSFAAIWTFTGFILSIKAGEFKAFNKAIQPLAEGALVVADAAMAIGHRFCPKIEVLWPGKFDEVGLHQGVKLIINSEDTGNIVWQVTDVAFSKDKERIRVNLQDTQPGREWYTYHLMYTIAGEFFDEDFTIVPDVHVVEEESPA